MPGEGKSHSAAEGFLERLIPSLDCCADANMESSLHSRRDLSRTTIVGVRAKFALIIAMQANRVLINVCCRYSGSTSTDAGDGLQLRGEITATPVFRVMASMQVNGYPCTLSCQAPRCVYAYCCVELRYRMVMRDRA